MDIETALVTYLNQRAGLTAIVSNRIYGLLVPTANQGQSNYPCVTYQVISDANVHSLKGASGLARPRFQITAWGATMADMRAVRGALKDALDGYSGLMGTVTVQACLKIDERDASPDPNASPGLQAARAYGRQMDFFIQYTEPRPTFA